VTSIVFLHLVKRTHISSVEVPLTLDLDRAATVAKSLAEMDASMSAMNAAPTAITVLPDKSAGLKTQAAATLGT
jgi:hypothetical protein